jgi:hypothetical protein
MSEDLPAKLEDLRRLLPFALAEERDEIAAALAATQKTLNAEPEFVDPTFPHQGNFLHDTARYLAMVGPRRKGKSNSIARKMLQRAWKHPSGKQGFQSMYIGLTGKQARISFWEPALKPTLQQLGIEAHLNEQEMTCTLPNGHVIYVMGMDSQNQIKDRARGGGYATVAVDEAATFVLALDAIFAEVIEPAVADVMGTIILAGTPGYVKVGMFFRITGAEEHNKPKPDRWNVVDTATASTWSVHRWTGFENPYMKKQISELISAKLAINPAIELLPSFQREWRGLWVLDDSKLVYRFDPIRNTFTALPELPPEGWHWGLVADMGYRPDPVAMGVLAWHDYEKKLYGRAMTQKLGLLTDGIVGLAHGFEKTYRGGAPFDFYVIDGAEIRAVEEMRRRHNLPWKAADKRGKSDFIEMMNSDWLLGRILTHATDCSWEKEETITCATLAEEYTQLVWDLKELEVGNRVESAACANHGTDVMLYGWRYAYPYLSTPPVQKPKYGTTEYYEQQEADRLAAAMEAARQRRAAAQGGSDGDPYAAQEPSDLQEF